MKNTTEIKRVGGRKEVNAVGFNEEFPAQWEIKLIVYIVQRKRFVRINSWAIRDTGLSLKGE